MLNKLSYTVFILALWINTCMAQSNSGSQEVTNWGASISGVQLSVVVSNNVIVADSTTILHCRIKNSSTNVVAFSDTGMPMYDSDVSLLDSSGKIYDLTPADKSSRAIYMRILIKVNPAQTYEWNIPLKLEKSIKSGNYKLKVSREIYIRDNKYKVVSNLLEVQVN